MHWSTEVHNGRPATASYFFQSQVMVTLTLTRLAYVGGKRWTRVEEEEEPPGHVVVVVTSSKTFVRRVD